MFKKTIQCKDKICDEIVGQTECSPCHHRLLLDVPVKLHVILYMAGNRAVPVRGRTDSRTAQDCSAHSSGSNHMGQSYVTADPNQILREQTACCSETYSLKSRCT